MSHSLSQLKSLGKALAKPALKPVDKPVTPTVPVLPKVTVPVTEPPKQQSEPSQVTAHQPVDESESSSGEDSDSDEVEDSVNPSAPPPPQQGNAAPVPTPSTPNPASPAPPTPSAPQPTGPKKNRISLSKKLHLHLSVGKIKSFLKKVLGVTRMKEGLDVCLTGLIEFLMLQFFEYCAINSKSEQQNHMSLHVLAKEFTPYRCLGLHTFLDKQPYPQLVQSRVFSTNKYSSHETMKNCPGVTTEPIEIKKEVAADGTIKYSIEEYVPLSDKIAAAYPDISVKPSDALLLHFNKGLISKRGNSNTESKSALKSTLNHVKRQVILPPVLNEKKKKASGGNAKKRKREEDSAPEKKDDQPKEKKSKKQKIDKN
jgi:hypothetical protein